MLSIRAEQELANEMREWYTETNIHFQLAYEHLRKGKSIQEEDGDEIEVAAELVAIAASTNKRELVQIPH